MKTLASTLISILISVSAQSQIFVPNNYTQTEFKSSSIKVIYTKTFNSKEGAINNHMRILSMNNIDTTYTEVMTEWDCPIFSHFFGSSDDIVYVSYVIKNGQTSNYNSVFLVCENVPIEFFNSDNQNLYYEPTRRNR